MSRLRILALSFFPAYLPPRNGGVERLFRIYSLLSRRFDVTLISSAEVGGQISTVEHSANFREIRVPKDAAFETAYEELRAFSGDGDLSGPALGLSTKASGILHDQYLAHYAQSDIIIHDSPFLVGCDVFRGFDNKLRVYNSYNCETDLYASFHSVNDTKRRIEKLTQELESDLCRHANLITACSEEDRQRFTDLFAPSSPIEIVPNGVVPLPVPTRRELGNNRLVFIGSGHKPNVNAAKFVVEELAPQYRDYEFHLVGSCYPRMRRKNVIAHGVVTGAEKKMLLENAFAAINPITTGSGSSLKVADIAVSGTPLISTELGVRGFDLVRGHHYVALQKEQFTKFLARELADRERLASVAANAREHITERFSWPKIAERFADRLTELCESRENVRPYVVLNDYDSLSMTGGGATRTAGLCRGLAEHHRVIFLTFGPDSGPARRVSRDGRILTLFAAKAPDHVAEHQVDDALYWISTADIVNFLHAPRNGRMVNLFRCAASLSRQVICEHPYMVGLPRLLGTDFVYSSQNFEYGMKAHSLRDHPRGAERIATVREAEAFACGASSLIIAVSDEDARSFSGSYSFTAPIMVIPNGADGPPNGKRRGKGRRTSGERPVAVFMGSSHGPNIEAAQWIADTLAPATKDVDFVILGGVADSVTGRKAPNVKLAGQVSTAKKSDCLHSARVALNPMSSGSGSNVKVADYLQHGLPVLSTKFGARGYDLVPEEDMVIAELSDFGDCLKRLLSSPASREKACAERQKRYLHKLSMDEGGRELHRLVEEHGGDQPRALYVTYRYNDPPQGGGEDYVVRLIHALAADGWNVDVAAPAAERISDVWRFGAAFAGEQWQPVPIGVPRVRSAKFDLDRGAAQADDLRRFWSVQPQYEAEVFRALSSQPDRPTLTWGWGDVEGRGRWCFTQAGLFLPEPAKLLLTGDPQGRLWFQIFSEAGELLHDQECDDLFTVECDVPAGFVELRSSVQADRQIDDPRPLAFFARRISVDGLDLLPDRPMEVWARQNAPAQQLAAHAAARQVTRDSKQLELSSVRNASSELQSFVEANVGRYDLLITHNAVFQNTIDAVRHAKRSGTPSIFIPHLHYDDDFYHFSDVLDACASATRTLVCPSVTKEFLASEGLTNLVYHAPGIAGSERFEQEDADAFRAVLGNNDDFFLVLGRKAPAKGYADVIRAADEYQGDGDPLIVLIGPDDDRVAIDSERAIYLGRQPDNVVRGALMECLGLINMSRSESFGMVLLEAGLAGKPVLANRSCAAFADIVEDGANGFLVTPQELKDRMAELIADPRLRHRLGKAGRKKALARDWTVIQRDFIDLCNSVVEQHG